MPSLMLFECMVGAALDKDDLRCMNGSFRICKVMICPNLKKKRFGGVEKGFCQESDLSWCKLNQSVSKCEPQLSSQRPKSVIQELLEHYLEQFNILKPDGLTFSFQMSKSFLSNNMYSHGNGR